MRDEPAAMEMAPENIAVNPVTITTILFSVAPCTPASKPTVLIKPS